MTDQPPGTFRFALDQRVRLAGDPSAIYTIEQCRYTAACTAEYLLADTGGVWGPWVPEANIRAVDRAEP